MFVTSESVETDVEGLTKRFIAVLSKSTSAFCNNHKPHCLASLSNRVTWCPMVAARCFCFVNFKHLINTLFVVGVSKKWTENLLLKNNFTHFIVYFSSPFKCK